MYGISGRAAIDEREVDSLPGYRGMGPVRVGNQAYRQVQHDVYGSAILAATHVFFDQRLVQRGDEALFHRLEALGERAAALFDQPDAGIWELRGVDARAHVLQHDVLGRVRPAGQNRGAPRTRRPGRVLARPCRAHPPGGVRAVVESRSSEASWRPWKATRSTRACCA